MKGLHKKPLVIVITSVALLLLLFIMGSLLFQTKEETAESELVTEGDWVKTYANKWAVVPEWSSSPDIDGQLTEKVWLEEAAVLDGFTTAFHEEPLSHEVEYRVAYDSQHLYVGGRLARAEANTLSQIEIVLRPTVGQGEHYVVRLDINPQSPTITTILNSVPDGVDMTIDLGRKNIENVVYDTFADEDEWFVEASIPLAEITSTGPAKGDEWQFNIVHLHNIYTEPLNAWVPIRSANHWHAGGETARVNVSVVDQDRLGTLYFGQLPETASFPEHDIINWYPHEQHMEYVEFTKKKVTFDLTQWNVSSSLMEKFRQVLPGKEKRQQNSDAWNVALQWKEPHRDWEALTEATVELTDSQLNVNFDHPEPLTDGMYHLRIALQTEKENYTAMISFDREALIQAGLAKASIPQSTESVEAITWSKPSQAVQKAMELIPEQPGFRFVSLPELPELYPENLYRLSPDGKKLVSTRTNTVYPNDQYPEDQELIVKNGLGETVIIPYHEDAEGNRYFITGQLWYLQKSEALKRTGLIAKTDPLGAARLLHRWVEAYQSYNPTGDRVGSGIRHNDVTDKSSGPPYAYWGGIWNRWYLNDLTSMRPLLDAYTEIKKTNAFELLSEELGVDVEEAFIQDLVIPSADFVLSYVNRYGNMAFRPWIGLIEIGKALNEPDYIHRVVEQVEAFAARMFLSDGFWKEVTPSYHMQTVNEMASVAEKLKGWTDPPTYVSPRTGTRFDDLDLEAEIPIIAKSMDISRRVSYPNRKVLPITDTWASQNAASGKRDDGPFLLPAAGVGRLTGGESHDQTQVYLQFQPRYGHTHYDPLHMSLYAQRQELLPDLGYSHSTIYRYFALSTMGHNTVVVDSANMRGGAATEHGGQVRAYVPDGGLFQAIRASYEAAYEATEEYSREPWFVPFPDGTGETGYVLDLFRVTGGSRHEYTFQGDANRDAYFHTELPLTDYGEYLLPAGTKVVEPTSNSDPGSAEGHYPGYIYVRDVKQVQLEGEQYSLTLETEDNGRPGAGMRITGLLDSGNHELFLGRSPSLRSIRLHGSSMDNNDEAVKYDMPKLVLRRDGTDLQSVFTTVMEPYDHEAGPRIEAVERLTLDEGPEGAVAVRMVYGDVTDVVLSNPYHPEQPLVIGDLTMQGEMGMVRLVNGQVKDMSLIGGTLLAKGDQQLQGGGIVTGTITDTKRVAAGDAVDALVTTANVPEEAIGSYVIVNHPDGSTRGFEIGDIVQEQGQTLLVLAEHDPGFAFDDESNAKQMFFPHLKWTGTHTFSIALVDRTESK